MENRRRVRYSLPQEISKGGIAVTAAVRRGKGAARAITALLCIILGLALACNLAFIISGALSPEKPPSVLGLTPMVVLSGSMSGQAEDSLEVGDLALIRRVEPETLAVGDIVAYMSGGSAVTHRITAIETSEDGSLLFTTKGDANNAEDTEKVPEGSLIGRCAGSLAGAGDFLLFLRSPAGLALFAGLPLAALLGWELLSRRRAAEARRRELEAELRRARAAARPEPQPESFDLDDILSAKY